MSLSRAVLHGAGHSVISAMLYGDVADVDLDVWNPVTGPVDGEVCMTFEVLIGLAGAAACEAEGLSRPFKGAEGDLEKVCQVVPDDNRREALYREVLEFFSSTDGGLMLRRVARALVMRRRLPGAEIEERINGRRRGVVVPWWRAPCDPAVAEGAEAMKTTIHPSDDTVDKLLSGLLLECVQRDADAILIEPQERGIAAQLLKGTMRTNFLEVPLRLKDELTKRLKKMSGLNPEKTGSQAGVVWGKILTYADDSAFRLRSPESRLDIEFRILCRPTEFGEHITLTRRRQ